MKMTPSTLLNIILVTILLSSMFFMSTRSMSGNTEATSSNYATTSISKYDPWLDIDDNGFIDIKDILTVVLSYGATGDPTKKVTIAEYQTLTWTVEVHVPKQDCEWFRNDTEGYRQITVYIWTTWTVEIIIWFCIEGPCFIVDSFVAQANEPVGKTYQIQGNSIRVFIENYQDIEGDAEFRFYMTA